MSYSLISWYAKRCPISHVIQLDAKLILSPVSADLFGPEVSVLRSKAENTTYVVVAIDVPVAVGYACC